MLTSLPLHSASFQGKDLNIVIFTTTSISRAPKVASLFRFGCFPRFLPGLIHAYIIKACMILGTLGTY